MRGFVGFWSRDIENAETTVLPVLSDRAMYVLRSEGVERASGV